ncbi:PEP-CTERM sorting domain-containing protein [Saccharophagus degradans]
MCYSGGPSTSVPEPSTLMLFGLAAFGLGIRRKSSLNSTFYFYHP